MHLNTALYAASALVASYVCYQIVQNYQKLKDIPGPFWAKLSDLQRLIWVKSLRSHKIYQKLHEDYGECVRIGPNVVSVSNPAYIQTLYPTRLGFVKVSTSYSRNIQPSPEFTLRNHILLMYNSEVNIF